jgi:hypothetical protein
MGSGRWAAMRLALLLGTLDEDGAPVGVEKTSDSNSTPIELGNKGTACLDLTVSNFDGGTDEVQHLAIDATGGTYTLTYAGQTTAAIAYNANAAAVQAALVALSNLAPGDVVVTGGPGASADLVITFGGTLAKRNVAAITTNAASLTGGAGTATITTATAGVTPTLVATVKTCKTANGTFRTVAAFATVSGTDLDSGTYTERKSFTGLDRFVRVDWALTGTDAAPTFAVTGEAKLSRAHQAHPPRGHSRRRRQHNRCRPGREWPPLPLL